jgi:serine protease AprX
VIRLPQWDQKISSLLLRPEFTENPDKPCRLIVEMASSFTDKIASYVESNEGKVHCEMRLVPSIVVEMPYSAIQLMVLSPHVRKIWHDTRVSILLNIAVPTVGGSKAHDLGFTGKDITVAVIDTGIFPHSDLIYPENRIVGWHDLVNNRESPYDDNGHGTHVTGIIAGNGGASRGKYTGMAPDVKLVGVKALDKDGGGNTSDVITAVEWCIQNRETYNIRAINLSLGAAAQDSYSQDPLSRAVSAAWNSGMVVCIAAGNDGPDLGTINTPGINPKAITVGNLDDKGTEDATDDTISDSSSRGPTIDNLVKPDLLAPGTNIMSLRVGGGYRALTGTSMAAPMATGAVAQILQQSPSLKPDQVKNLILKNARDLGLESNFEGSGALNMESVFEPPQKEASSQENPLSKMITGLRSIFSKLSPKKIPAGETTADSSAKKMKLNIANPLPLALLMLLPIAFV